ncbi:DUF4279 domain-containing protein [Xanthomonas euvesicatoria]|uniref:DUF4279 domain-containing protein n=1 Tax=Xanthomonas euvesicatoria TaxID=456327 RepID=UPI001C4529DE|nr:DUF4279 domain-containing protein [Xanthomonas euvesicatoria]MBV6865023.1 DUF4279 domain-containing protein [Xanthomonas campestris pv. coriandri]MCE4328136.1 DUF4279 domain-containing protein [Xanthomonas campestris pv. coriandri]
MGALEYSVATLRFFGDDLVPDEISALLSGSPTASQHKGQERKSKNGVVGIAKTGSWRLTATRREPEDLEAQIFEILDQLTQDLSMWAQLSSRYQPDLFCGIFMAKSNDGLALSAKAMLALGQRGISLGLDIYDPTS